MTAHTARTLGVTLTRLLYDSTFSIRINLIFSDKIPSSLVVKLSSDIAQHSLRYEVTGRGQVSKYVCSVFLSSLTFSTTSMLDV